MTDHYQKSLAQHKKYQGKLRTEAIAHIETRDDLSWAYSPGVAEPCREIAKDASKLYDYTLKSRTVAVISDGSAILGLGNLGHKASMPVMEGKCVLFKEFA
jgi:malate dehydrogenase (oxaloacetate-decarboxylating)